MILAARYSLDPVLAAGALVSGVCIGALLMWVGAVKR